jgi:hypothetical protein
MRKSSFVCVFLVICSIAQAEVLTSVPRIVDGDRMDVGGRQAMVLYA